MVGTCCKGPGYVSPKDAFLHGPREELLYVPCVVPDHSRPDYLATIDINPQSASYSQVIHRLDMPHVGDELHHSGWNSCSSCVHDATAPKRSLLILPCLGSGRVYAVDTATDARAPRIAHVAERDDIVAATGLSYLHTSHCVPSGHIMVSAMGDAKGKPRGSFLLLDQSLQVQGVWSEEDTPYGYDYWYQPRLNVMVSSGWGAPEAFSKGFDPSLVPTHYSSSLHVWDWARRKHTQTLELGPKGLIPLEVRFLHEPTAPHGFVGAALSSTLVHISRVGGTEPAAPPPANGDAVAHAANGHDAPVPAVGEWRADVVAEQPWTKVEGWLLPEVPPLITDILISLDDKYLYLSNWLRGDVVQYDISDPAHPRVAGRVWLGGVLHQDSGVKVISGLPEDTPEQPRLPQVKGHTLRGGPQMLQLSLDGRRLFVTNSLYSPWDKQFYPDMVNKGSHLVQVDVDIENGGLSLNPDVWVDFGSEPHGPVLAHEVRYPGGDCSSDIWL